MDLKTKTKFQKFQERVEERMTYKYNKRSLYEKVYPDRKPGNSNRHYTRMTIPQLRKKLIQQSKMTVEVSMNPGDMNHPIFKKEREA